MELKRLYHRILDDSGQPTTEPMTDPNGTVLRHPNGEVKERIKVRQESGVPVVRGICIRRMPTNGRHNFSPNLIESGKAEGWLTHTDDMITIHCTEHGDVNFRVLRPPARYCLHCGMSFAADPSGALSRHHVETEHKKKKSPDPNWPAGYEVLNYYESEVV